MSASSTARAATWWDLVTLSVVVLLGIAHVSFVLADGRLPQDPGLYYTQVPSAHAAWSSLDLGGLLAVLRSRGGWYNLLLGLALALTGRAPWAMSALEVLSVMVTTLGTGLLARRAGGPAAGAAAALLVASTPVIVITGRTSWIHTPETALIVLAALAWARDLALARWRTALAVGLLGALAVSLRPSGLVWMALLLPLVLWTARARWPRVLAAAGMWGVGALTLIPQLQEYMRAKSVSRARYADQLPALAEQLLVNLDPWLVIAAGAAALGLAWRRPRGTSPLAALGLSWSLGALALWVLFRAGMDNFPLIAPGLALLAGWGLARLHPAAALALPLAGFFYAYVPQWVSAERIRGTGWGMLVRKHQLYHHHRNYYRVFQRYDHTQAAALIAAICPPPQEDGGCVIGVDQGLVRPYTEDPGELELFLMGLSRPVRLVSLREEGPARGSIAYDAVVEYNCLGVQEVQWRERFPHSVDLLRKVIEAEDLQPAWIGSLSVDCEVMWMTPGGRIADEDALPEKGRRPDPLEE